VRHLLREVMGPLPHLLFPPTPDLIHPPILESRTFRWADESACERFAAALADQPALRQAHIELDGPLGAGKTTFVRHLLRRLGVRGRIKSPTYAVVEPYEVDGLAVSHFDFYRFTDPREWEDAGLRDLFAAPGLKLSEWADKARAMLPPPDLRLAIEPADDDSRTVTAQAASAIGLALLDAGARA
jgi:tRNA threonylcarbamoyladenosine biosynthesis protein TsaE